MQPTASLVLRIHLLKDLRMQTENDYNRFCDNIKFPPRILRAAPITAAAALVALVVMVGWVV